MSNVCSLNNIMHYNVYFIIREFEIFMVGRKKILWKYDFLFFLLHSTAYIITVVQCTPTLNIILICRYTM